jgi:hypothetical protein
MAVRRRGARKLRCGCPLFRPAIMLSALPLESRDFRTPQECPSNPGLTDKLPTTSQTDELAALVEAQDSVQKSTPDNFQNNKHKPTPRLPYSSQIEPCASAALQSGGKAHWRKRAL